MLLGTWVCLFKSLLFWVHYMQVSVVLLCFTLLGFTDTTSFINLRFVATRKQESLLAAFFQQRLLTSGLCVTLW